MSQPCSSKVHRRSTSMAESHPSISSQRLSTGSSRHSIYRVSAHSGMPIAEKESEITCSRHELLPKSVPERSGAKQSSAHATEANKENRAPINSEDQDPPMVVATAMEVEVLPEGLEGAASFPYFPTSPHEEQPMETTLETLKSGSSFDLTQKTKKKSRKKAEHIPSPLNNQSHHVACMDIEGVEENIVEIAMLISTSEGIAEAVMLHVWPKNPREARINAKYCHGIDITVLRSLTKMVLAEAEEKVQRWLRKWNPVVVVSADNLRKSDVYKFIKKWQMVYTHVELPPWSRRVSSWSHQEAREKHLCNEEIRAGAAVCPYSRLHTVTVVKGTHDERTPAHCALLDACELHYSLVYDNKYAMVKHAARVGDI